MQRKEIFHKGHEEAPGENYSYLRELLSGWYFVFTNIPTGVPSDT
jgi:hypothetical protein